MAYKIIARLQHTDDYDMTQKRFTYASLDKAMRRLVQYYNRGWLVEVQQEYAKDCFEWVPYWSGERQQYFHKYLDMSPARLRELNRSK